MELEIEKREHLLVIETVKDIEGKIENLFQRKRWKKMLASSRVILQNLNINREVLVEKQLGEVIPNLKDSIDLLDKAILNISNALKLKEKELIDIEIKYGFRP